MVKKANSTYINPGILEVYCGPMKCGKSRELINRVDKLQYISGSDVIFFKPKTDTRDKTVKSRFGNLSYNCIFIESNKPENIISHILNTEENIDVIVIDEIQFFQEEIINVIKTLLKNDINVIAAGLDLDFKGEPFGSMPHILTLADTVTKLHAICEHENCNAHATRTQRLIKGKPAHYNSPLILIGDTEHYESRCLLHHFVPRD